MAILGLLPRARSLAGYKLAAGQASITGTGGIVTGLTTIPAGGAVVSVANSATTLTTDVASITSISAGTVNVSVTLLTFSGPTIALESGAKLVNCIAVGT